VKRKVSVTIDREVYEKAHSLGINVSKASENYLIMLINAIEQSNGENKVFSRGFSAEKSRMVRSPGFEPGSSTWQGPTHVDWRGFEEWLKAKKYRGSGVRTKLSYAVRYHGILFRGELSKRAELSPDSKANALKALSALCKFLGCYGEFQKHKKNSGLTWTGKSAEKIFIERLNKVKDPSEVFGWIRDAKKAKPCLSRLLDLLAVSGLRLIEAVESYNLIIRLSKDGKLGDYFNGDTCALEHFRFEKVFLRKSKKALVSFVPNALVAEIGKGYVLASSSAVSKALRKAGVKPRFADIRENHGSFMTKFLNETEINFLHGRVANGVFMQHYYNPSLIGDIRERTFLGINEILEKIQC
jgi:intergrase/recombinase